MKPTMKGIGQPHGTPGRDATPPPAEGKNPQKLAIGVPLSKLIPRKLEEAPEIVMMSAPRSVPAERFRRVKTLLEQQDSPEIVVVSSAIPGEGKSVVATNLALAYADGEGETLLIDADLRQPSLGRWVKPDPTLGLTEVLMRDVDLEHAILSLKNTNLRVLPAGSVPKDPLELLSSDWAKALLSGLRKRFRRIVVDTPPVVLFTDASVLGEVADGVLLVARAGRTPETMFSQALSTLSTSRVLGVVLNDTRFNLADRQRLNSRYYESYYGREDKG